MTLETAVDEAVRSCIKEDILKSFLEKHRMEVKNVILTEFDEETYRKSLLDEGREEGLREGLTEGILRERTDSLLRYFQKKGVLSEDLKERISRETDLTVLETWQDMAFEGMPPEEIKKQILAR